MLNEPLFQFFIKVFSKSLELILWQVINESKRGFCTFFKINCAIVWSMHNKMLVFFFSNTSLYNLCIEKRSWPRKLYIKNASPYLVACMKIFTITNKGFKPLKLHIISLMLLLCLRLCTYPFLCSSPNVHPHHGFPPTRLWD